MIVCYFGIYNSEYNRNRVIIKGLRQNGIQVLECSSCARGLKKYFDLYNKHKKIIQYDLMLVGFPGYQAMILAKIISRKKIVFDAFSSFYDSMINDRKTASSVSIFAWYYWLLDWLSCSLADKVLLDTDGQIEYFVKTFKIKREKFIRVFVGSDDDLLKPLTPTEKNKDFIVHFHGSNIPLQGVEYIVEAAKILSNENIKFNIIGTKIKKQYQDVKTENVNLIDNVSYEKLNQYMSDADACLGIFGNTAKALRVIPNKLYEALAAGKPTITAKTPATAELLVDRESILFCNPADSCDLAEKILILKDDNALRDKIARNGYNLFCAELTPKKIVAGLLTKI